MGNNQVTIKIQNHNSTNVCPTDNMPLISRLINKLLESHSMPLFNHYFITLNELLFFWQSERFCCLCIRVIIIKPKLVYMVYVVNIHFASVWNKNLPLPHPFLYNYNISIIIQFKILVHLHVLKIN